MAKSNDDGKMNPPYVAFSTFKRLIETLSKTAVPSRIDRSVLPKMSGVTQSQLTSALKFLGLIGPDGTTNQRLHDLVKAYGTEQWPEELSDTISDHYHTIIGNLDLDSGTANELRDAFRGRGKVDGQLLMKAVRFYLKGMGEANLEISPHFKAPSLSTMTKKKKKKSKPNGQSSTPSSDYTPDPDNEDDSATPQPTGTLSYPIGKERFMHLPIDLTDADCDAIEAAMPLLRTIAKLPKGGAS